MLTGADALTASERRVAQIAAGGRTNKQNAQSCSLAPEPVQIHLARWCENLDISSRTELAMALALVEIGPKRRFFGPIPAEMSGNWRKIGAAAGPSPPRKPCKQAKLRASARLDRTQEVAGSSPASSTPESLL